MPLGPPLVIDRSLVGDPDPDGLGKRGPRVVMKPTRSVVPRSTLDMHRLEMRSEYNGNMEPVICIFSIF
jgi:hypothetical protein